MDFYKTLAIAASGLRAQAGRMRIISQNIANADSTPSSPGADPYRRKIPTFQVEFDRALGTNLVEMGRVQADSSDFCIYYADVITRNSEQLGILGVVNNQITTSRDLLRFVTANRFQTVMTLPGGAGEGPM